VRTWFYGLNLFWEKFPALLKSHTRLLKKQENPENNRFRLPTHFQTNRFTLDKFPPPPPLLHPNIYLYITYTYIYICVYIYICIHMNNCTPSVNFPDEIGGLAVWRHNQKKTKSSRGHKRNIVNCSCCPLRVGHNKSATINQAQSATIDRADSQKSTWFSKSSRPPTRENRIGSNNFRWKRS
jgi:hypothetical protein